MAQLICDYPDRFIMGSDALISRNQGSIDKTYAVYSNFGGGVGTAGRTSLFDRLPPHVLSKVLTGNFEAMMNQAVIDADSYDARVLPNDLAQIQQSIDENRRVPNTWASESGPIKEISMNTQRKIEIRGSRNLPPSPIIKPISMNTQRKIVIRGSRNPPPSPIIKPKA